LQVKFGEILRKIRLSKGYSQQKLAFNSNLDRTYISLLERGLRMPTLETLFKISYALNVKPVDIIKELESNYESNNR